MIVQDTYQVIDYLLFVQLSRVCNFCFQILADIIQLARRTLNGTQPDRLIEVTTTTTTEQKNTYIYTER